MKTHPFLLGSHSFSLTTQRVFNQWYLLPSLEIEDQIPLGGAARATRIIVSFLRWRCALEISGVSTQRCRSLNEVNFQEFAEWLKSVHSTLPIDRTKFFTLLGANPALERLVLSRGLKPYYVKILILKTFVEAN